MRGSIEFPATPVNETNSYAIVPLNMIEVSTIIPTFNRKDRLRKALASVFEQNVQSMEILVMDDGSTDGTGEMMTQEFPSVQYRFFPNRGPSFARNRGVEAAKGRWIAFLDSDDCWLPGKIKTQLEFFRTHPEFRIVQTEEIWIRNGKRVNPMKKHRKYHGHIFKECLPLCIVSPSAVMMEKSLFEETGGFDESLPACEDYDLWLRIAAHFPIGLIKTPCLLKYGGHPDQLSRAFEAMDSFRIASLLKLLSSGTLDEEKTYAAKLMLRKKSSVFIQGAFKRGKLREAQAMEEKIKFFLPAAEETTRV